jgi:DNA-binding transcriptional LysR family regulator
MELHHLRCAVAVADHGSFTHAARALHITQPSLSYSIAKLELELGAALFERGTHGVSLTAAGAAFLEPARCALREAQRGRSAVDAITGNVPGDLDIACITSVVVEAASFVAQYHRLYPSVLVRLHQPGTDDDVDAFLVRGQCDAVVIRHHDGLPPEFPIIELGAEEVVALFPDSMAPESEVIAMDDLGNYPIIAPVVGSPERRGWDRLLFNAGVTPVVVAECGYTDASIELVRGGLGVRLVAGSRVWSINRDGIAVRRLDPPRLNRLAVAFRSEELSPAAEGFRRMLTLAVAESGDLRLAPIAQAS